MRESKFVEQNQEKWSRFEQELKSSQTNPESLRVQLIEVTDDLSYARTFYKNRSVRLYLNGLAQKVYLSIYKNKRDFKKNIIKFFQEDVPKIAYNSRKEMLIAFLILVLSVLIGAFSSAKNQQFPVSILGQAYVDETIKNINKGDPMGIYKSQDSFDMFVMIATNNLKVSLMVFLFGLLAAYGSLFLLIRNGIMLGVFMYFFYSRNIVLEFNLTVWMHGTIEILTLVISALSGMLLGRGLIYPGTLSRAKAFSVWARRGALLFLSTTPFILFAALIESYLTRHTELSNLLRFCFILLSAGLMLYYFVIYPYLKYKNVKDTDLGMPELTPDSNFIFKTKHIYSNSEIFIFTIEFIRRNFSDIIKVVFISGLILIVVYSLFNYEDILLNFKVINADFFDLVNFDIFAKIGEAFSNLGILFNSIESPNIYFFSSLWMLILVLLSIYIFIKDTKIEVKIKDFFLPILLFCFLINLLLLFDNGFFFLIYILIFPALLSALIQKYIHSIKTSTKTPYHLMLIGGFNKFLGLNVLGILLISMGLVFFISPLSFISIWVVEMNFELSESAYEGFIRFVLLFWFALLSGFFIVFYVLQICFASFSIIEIQTANGIKESIQKIGSSKKIYGLETEL